MFDFNTLTEFSHANCITICAFLIPANLVATSLTIIFTALVRPTVQVWQATGIATIFALLMMWHVFTWFMVGIVLIPTYILLGLGSTCLFINIVAIAYSYNPVRLEKHYKYVHNPVRRDCVSVNGLPKPVASKGSCL
jgi:hypothetical protein